MAGGAPGRPDDAEAARLQAAIERNPDDVDARLELARTTSGART